MSSFRKRHVQKPINGTRTSPQTGQIITSSGNPSLDVLLGGGLPIGSIVLIEEDKYVTYAKVLAKYFLAEGITSAQTVFLGSLDDDPVALMNKLPKPLTENDTSNEQEEPKEAANNDIEANGDKGKNGLRIAWRYNDLPMMSSEPTSTKIGHHFNLMEYMDPLLLALTETVTWHGGRAQSNESIKQTVSTQEDEETEEEDEIHYAANRQNNLNSNSSNNNETEVEAVPTTEQQAMEPPAEQEANNSLDKTASTDVMEMENHKSELESTLSCSSAEIAKGEPPKQPGVFENNKYLSLLQELQPLLHDDKFFHSAMVQKGLCRICITSLGSPLWYKDQRFGEDLLKFLTVLRACVRSIVSVCFITMPMRLIKKYDDTLVAKIRNLVDYSIELESFAGSERDTHPAYKDYNGLLHLRKISAVNALSAYMPETTDLAFKLRRKKFVIEKFHLPPDIEENSNTATTSCGTNSNCCSNKTGSPAKSLI